MASVLRPLLIFAACAAAMFLGGSVCAAQACVPRQQLPCACPRGLPGVEVCSSDGAGFGPCLCRWKRSRVLFGFGIATVSTGGLGLMIGGALAELHPGQLEAAAAFLVAGGVLVAAGAIMMALGGRRMTRAEMEREDREGAAAWLPSLSVALEEHLLGWRF